MSDNDKIIEWAESTLARIKALDKAMTDTTYNGWKNYPTWAVNMWLSNDHGLYDHVREMVEEITAENESRSEYWTVAESHKFTMADLIKDLVTDTPDDGGLCPPLEGFASDLLGYALDCVDWDSIAEAWLED